MPSRAFGWSSTFLFAFEAELREGFAHTGNNYDRTGTAIGPGVRLQPLVTIEVVDPYRRAAEGGCVKRLAGMAALRLSKGDGRRAAIAALEVELREAFVSFRFREARQIADQLWTIDPDRRRAPRPSPEQMEAAVARLRVLIEKRLPTVPLAQT